MSTLDAIRKLSEDYETAHLAGDGQALARLFRDDAVIIPPGKPAIEGRKRIDEFFRDIAGGTGLKTETLRIEIYEPIAYAYGTNSWSETGKRRYFHYVDIYRLEDGKWKFQLLSWNSSEGISQD
jgi:uncharacterized protein (TIGR02246 family)